MSAEQEPVSGKMLWIGYLLSAVPVLMLTFSAVMKFLKPTVLVEGFSKMGWREELALPLGVVELACVVLYLVPRTSVLGAILITGYLGGATATHVRVDDAFVAPVILGMVAWAGLWFRNRRVRAVLPLTN